MTLVYHSNMNKAIDFLYNHNVSFQSKIHYISKLSLIDVIDIFDSHEITYLDYSLVLFIIIRILQHKTLGIQSIENRYYSNKIDKDVLIFSHIDEIELCKKHFRSLMLFLKRKQKFAFHYVTKILRKTSEFGRLPYDVIQNINTIYLGIEYNSIDIMVNRLGITISILDNIKRSHIRYLYQVEIWENMSEYNNQQGLMDAEDDKYSFMIDYKPDTKLLKWKILQCYKQINGNFQNLFTQWCVLNDIR